MVVESQVPPETKLVAVVEDDPELANVFREALKREANWRLHFFFDGQEAQRRLPELGAHLILLDVGLPNLDGASLYKMLRGHSNTRHTPIIVVTGSYEWELQRMGLQTALLLRKPFQIRELLIMMHALLGGTPAEEIADAFPPQDTEASSENSGKDE